MKGYFLYTLSIFSTTAFLVVSKSVDEFKSKFFEMFKSFETYVWNVIM